MCTKFRFLDLVLIGAALVMAGCVPAAPQSIDLSVEMPSSDVLAARNAVLTYLSGQFGDQAPPVGLAWVARLTTPEGLVGATSFEFTSGNWVLQLTYPIVAPGQEVYNITVDNSQTGFSWSGQVDANGQVMEDQAPANEQSDATPDALVLSARDRVLDYLSKHYGDQAPAIDLIWASELTTPEGLLGSMSYDFTAGEWVMHLSYPVTSLDQVIYHITLDNAQAKFHWVGEVDAKGDVSEIETSGTAQPVIGWVGHVASTPAGAQFDDYLILMPEGAGEVGVAGVTPEIEDEIQSLRNEQGIKEYASFWGTLTCDVPDYGGCQLLVTQVKHGQFLTEPVSVEGWQGTIACSHFNSAPGAPRGTAFILAGDFPVWYGIHSLDIEVNQQIENIRDTGKGLKVWGDLITGVLDVNGAQILVNRIEVIN